MLVETFNLQIEIEVILETKTFNLDNLANLTILVKFN